MDIENQYQERLARRREYDRQWRLANPDKVRAKYVKFHSAHPDAEKKRVRDPAKTRAYRLAWRARERSRSHGLTRAQVAEVFAQQGKRCAICGVADARWHGDHDHSTGVFRGVLCHHCNVGIGHFRDDVSRLLAAVEYLRSRAGVKGLL